MLCLFLSVAAADTPYVVHTSEGEFEKTTSPCGEETRDELFGLLKGQPVVTVGREDMQFTTRDSRDSAAPQYSAGVHATGTWTFGTKTLVVEVRHWGWGDHGPKVLNVTIERKRPAGKCTEHWQGIVLPSRTRETLRGQ
jgi:hypothetical protein